MLPSASTSAFGASRRRARSAASLSTRCPTCPNSWFTSQSMSELLARALLAAAVVYGGALAAAQSQPNAARQAEIQINICSDPQQTVRALKLRPSSRETTVWLFDDRALDLHREGLRLRLRLTKRGAELTLKVAGQDCGRYRAPAEGSGKCEADLHGTSFDDVVSLSRSLSQQQVDALIGPDPVRHQPVAEALRAVLTRSQRDLLATLRAGKADLIPPDLMALGPMKLRAYRPPGDKYVVEVWSLAAGAEFVELSERAPRDMALARHAELVDRVTAAGLVVCADQESQAGERL